MRDMILAYMGNAPGFGILSEAESRAIRQFNEAQHEGRIDAMARRVGEVERLGKELEDESRRARSGVWRKCRWCGERFWAVRWISGGLPSFCGKACQSAFKVSNRWGKGDGAS